jgi:peptide/nickel transport system substrate-binding protein
LNFKILSGPQIAAQLESGEIAMNYPGIGNIPVDDYARIMSLPHLVAHRTAPGTVQTLFYNNQVLDNVKVRQAMDMAIDREGILRNVFRGGAFMTRTPVSSAIEFWNEEAARYTFDPERARQLLAESGWDLSRRLVFVAPTGNATRERVCLIIAENFRAIGLNVVIERADFPATMRRIQQRDYDISILGMPANSLDAVRNLRFYVGSQDAYTGFSDPEVDRLLEILSASVDAEALRAAYYEIQDIIAEQAPVSGLYSELILYAVNRRVIYGGPQDFGILLNLERWDVE